MRLENYIIRNLVPCRPVYVRTLSLVRSVEKNYFSYTRCCQSKLQRKNTSASVGRQARLFGRPPTRGQCRSLPRHLHFTPDLYIRWINCYHELTLISTLTIIGSIKRFVLWWCRLLHISVRYFPAIGT